MAFREGLGVIHNYRNRKRRSVSRFSIITNKNCGFAIFQLTPWFVWSQQVAVDAATAYQFDVWTSTWFSNAGLQLQINSVDVGAFFTTPDINGEWELTTRFWNSGAATIAQLSLVNPSSNFVGNDFALDDIGFSSLASVPEPTNMIALASFGLLLFRRRRKVT